MSAPRFSVWPIPERPWSEVRDLALWAESEQWHCIWYADHFMPNTGDEAVADGDVHEAWSMIAALASITSRIRIGSIVSPTTVRHPAILANSAATIDRISDGRLTLGLGAGWQVNEHLAYGFDLLEPKDRVDRFEEALEICRRLLSEDRTTFIGRHFRFRDAPCQPRPVQHPLPIMVGTGGPRMTRITARLADQWNTWGTPEVAGERIAVLDEALARAGRDPSSMHRSVQAMFFIADDPEKADKIRRAAPTDRAVIGPTEKILEAVERYVDLGFDEIIFPDFTLGRSASERRESYERLGREVVAHWS